MTVVIDIVDGNTLVETPEGYTAQRVAIVNGVTGTASARIHTAMNDASIPDIGDVHPSIATIYCVQRDAEAIDNETVRVVLTYTDRPGFPADDNIEKRASVSLQSVETPYAFLSAVFFKTSYLTVTDDDAGSTTEIDEYVNATIDQPLIEYQFTYTTDDQTFPKADINLYVGTTNTATWNGYAAEKVLCSAIDVEPEGSEYRVTYTFLYNPYGWEATIKFAIPPEEIKSSTDTDLDTDSATKDFEIYPDVSWSAMPTFTI